MRILILLLLLTTGALADQSEIPINPDTGLPKEVRTPARNGGAKSPPEVPVKSIKIDSNFLARCAADMRWKDLTNKIAASSARLAKLHERQALVTQKASLAFTAGQSKNRMSPESKSIQTELKTEQANQAALLLQQIKVEEGIRKLIDPYGRKK